MVRNTVLGAVVIAVVVGAAVAGTAIGGPDRAAKSKAELTSVSQSQPQASDRARPRYLPPGATQGDDTSRHDGGVLVSSYRLSGSANADTRSTERHGTPEHHPPTVLTLLQSAGDKVAAPPADPEYARVSEVDINGAAGRLSEPLDGYGAYRVEWSDGESIFTLLSPRLHTGRTGMSGITTEELLKVARSVA